MIYFPFNFFFVEMFFRESVWMYVPYTKAQSLAEFYKYTYVLEQR